MTGPSKYVAENSLNFSSVISCFKFPMQVLCVPFQTSLVFTLRESPKDVHKTLSVFATSKTLKLTKVSMLQRKLNQLCEASEYVQVKSCFSWSWL